jgi:hypothetical protein
VGIGNSLKRLDDRIIGRAEETQQLRRRASVQARVGLAVIVTALLIAAYLSSGHHLAATLVVVVPVAVGLAFRLVVRLVAGQRR